MLKNIKLPSVAPIAAMVFSLGLGWGEIAQAYTPNTESYVGVEVAQADRAEALMSQLNQSMTTAFNGIEPFFQGLAQLDTVQNPQQGYAVLQQLIPMAAQITGNFARANEISQQLLSMLPADSQEAMAMQQMVAINTEGTQTFGGWIDILVPMNEALQNQDSNTLQQIVADKLPAVVSRTGNFIQGLQAFMATTNGNSNPNNGYSNYPQEGQVGNSPQQNDAQTYDDNMGQMNPMMNDIDDSGIQWQDNNPAMGQDE